MNTVSFIIPAYNSEKTIEKTISSILNQDDSDVEFEIIVVDDGSTDNTGDIIRKYERTVRYIKTDNNGVASARNTGVKYARGDYYIFVDSDDYVSQSLLSDMQKYIEIGADLIKWSPILVDEDGNKINENSENFLKKLINTKFKSDDEDIKNPNKEEAIFTNGEGGFNILYGTDPLMDCFRSNAFDNIKLKENVHY